MTASALGASRAEGARQGRHRGLVQHRGVEPCAYSAVPQVCNRWRSAGFCWSEAVVRSLLEQRGSVAGRCLGALVNDEASRARRRGDFCGQLSACLCAMKKAPASCSPPVHCTGRAERRSKVRAVAVSHRSQESLIMQRKRVQSRGMKMTGAAGRRRLPATPVLVLTSVQRGPGRSVRTRHASIAARTRPGKLIP